MLSSSVDSPRQTLREMARDQPELNPAHKLVIQRMRLLTHARHNAPRVCTSVLFIEVCNNMKSKAYVIVAFMQDVGNKSIYPAVYSPT